MPLEASRGVAAKYIEIAIQRERVRDKVNKDIFTALTRKGEKQENKGKINEDFKLFIQYNYTKDSGLTCPTVLLVEMQRNQKQI